MQRQFLRFHTAMFAAILGISLLVTGPSAVEAQERLPGDDIVRPWGQGIAPVFEGWYPNPDGDGYYVSFGYLNRNAEEIVDIPVGTSNFVDPEDLNGVQPTHFETRRHYGWFAVLVPEDFVEDQTANVLWTIDFRGERYEIPGRVTNPNYEIDAMYQAATGITPPIVTLEPDGEEIRGPHGNDPVDRTVSVGDPLEITVWAEDESWYGAPAVAGGELEPHTVTLRYYTYAGPGDISFDRDNIEIEPQEDLTEATNTATFSEPGVYRVYVRANNEGLVGAGQEQCCWTNVYFDVTVEE
ncbi:MAG: hypothetical protein ACLFWG_08030 [Longimicrobiales bacterium]